MLEYIPFQINPNGRLGATAVIDGINRVAFIIECSRTNDAEAIGGVQHWAHNLTFNFPTTFRLTALNGELKIWSPKLQLNSDAPTMPECIESVLHLIREKTITVTSLMQDDAHHICINIQMRSNAALDEPILRQALMQTFEALGGISRAIVHFDVLAIEQSQREPNLGVNQDWEAWICLHKGDSKFVKAALPTFAPSPTSPITGIGLRNESSSPPLNISSSA